jgi:hypothetical protein
MDAFLMAVNLLTWGIVILRFHCATVFQPINRPIPNATSGEHVEGIVRHNLDHIDTRQAIVLSYMAEDFCSSSATSGVSDSSWCDLSLDVGGSSEGYVVVRQSGYISLKREIMVQDASGG